MPPFDAAPAAEDLATRFGLRKTGGRDWNGPCPLCGGTDRFHVRDGDGRAIVGCRGCMDGRPERGQRYGEIMRLFRGQDHAAAPVRRPRPAPTPKRDTLPYARKLWAAAVQVPADPEHPARRWLAARHLWRPDLQLPPSVRWLPSTRGPAVGAIVAAFARPNTGKPSAVQLVHVDADGRPAPDRPGDRGLTKRSYGHMTGAVCVAGLPDASGGFVQVAEGLADTLALAARLPWPAVCLGGTPGFHNSDVARWLADFGGYVQVWRDPGEPGREAAEILTAAIVALGGAAVIKHAGGGTDPGAAGAPFAPLDEQQWRTYAADLERDGMPAWEAARVASTCARPAGKVARAASSAPAGQETRL